jgi:hypothetical protein
MDAATPKRVAALAPKLSLPDLMGAQKNGWSSPSELWKSGSAAGSDAASGPRPAGPGTLFAGSRVVLEGHLIEPGAALNVARMNRIAEA